ncbi:MAG: hypothetical protein J5J06_12820 [Phycisphaerae bacterium]|nr:hypothetical protein [Phycisphaerae bacterium]
MKIHRPIRTHTCVNTADEQQRGPAFTLVEVMLALLLTSSVVVLAGTVTVQVAQTGKAARQTLDREWRRAQLARRFAEDVEQRITWLPEKPASLRINSEGALLKVISLVHRSEPDAVTSRRFPARIRYFLEQASGIEGRGRLIRSISDLTITGHKESHVVAEGLSSAKIEVYIDGEWTMAMELDSNRRDKEIEAVRLVCVWADDGRPQAWSRTVLIESPVKRTTKNQ